MTLAVSTFYSDRIRCSVDIVGMSNLVTFLEHTEANRRDLRRVEYGDERDPKMREFLGKIAPMNNIEKIKKPMFVIAGKNDPRVPVSEEGWYARMADDRERRRPRLRQKAQPGFSVLRHRGIPPRVSAEVEANLNTENTESAEFTEKIIGCEGSDLFRGLV
jgi:hypothetical protein